MVRSNQRIEFGDFQTPEGLADRVCLHLADGGVRPATIIEPTCGIGNFLLSALRHFPEARTALGLDINDQYLSRLQGRLAEHPFPRPVKLHHEDFFTFDWKAALAACPRPALIVGNPPWVTSSRIGSLAGSNLPVKSNFMGHRGMDARTGKSNFDVSEWITLRLLELAGESDVTVALLLKTSVARRVLLYAWSRDIPVGDVRLLRFDASEAFGANTDAAVLVFNTTRATSDLTCQVFGVDDWNTRTGRFGIRGGALVAEPDAYDETSHLARQQTSPPSLRWRSGVKHDCGRVLEIQRKDGRLHNGLDELVDVEPEWVFPLLKGSDVAAGRVSGRETNERFLIVPQREPGEDTAHLETAAPRLWAYLNRHAGPLQARKSSIYRGRPPFSVFGVGPYTFAPWKVAICGLYKKLSFALIGPVHGRPVMLDDTSYHLSFVNRNEAEMVLGLLNSDAAQRFFKARVFWDAKRPITAELLHQLDLFRLADVLGLGREWDRLSGRTPLFQLVME